MVAAAALVLTSAAQRAWADDAAGAPDTMDLRRMQIMAHAADETSPDLIGTAEEIIPLQPRPWYAQPTATIFGYLPYWESAQYLRYDLLTHLACFSVGVNANGTLGNDRGWPWVATINAAHANGVKVILVATLFDGTNINTLITTPAYKSAFFANIKAKMLEGKADGLNIDFEGSGNTWKANINAFMADLTAYMHAELPGSEVTFAGPAVNWSNAWNLVGLASSCDGIFIMGYAFAGSWSTTSGPNSPLIGGSINITDTIVDEYAAVTAAMPEKLILGIPYYGGHWITTSSAARSSVVSWQGATWFRDDEPASQTYGVLWDATSQTPWYRWQQSGQWHQVWFDNATSLGLKYNLAKYYHLQGVGMWALGYDGDRPELWDALEQRFGAPGLVPPDLDHDGDVDVADFGYFQLCFNGPQRPPAIAGDCDITDFDGDADVDLADFGELLACFNGPNRPPACQ